MKTTLSGSRFQLPVLFSFVLASLFVIGAGTPLSYALPMEQHFGIYYDNTCKTMLRNNVTTVCPSYEDIITLFPDTSIQDVSGHFAYSDGLYQRQPTKWTNSIEYYRFSESPILFIDPPTKTKTLIKLIEIKANLDEYLIRGANPSYNKIDHTMTMGVGRFVDNCKVAYVDAKQWAEWIGDSMWYMNNGCKPEFTKMNSTKTTQLYKTEHDITTSYKYKLEAWQKEMINRCGHKVCIYESGQPTPP